MASDWTYIVTRLAKTRTQRELEDVLRSDGADIVSNPTRQQLSEALISAIEAPGGVRLVKGGGGSRLVFAMQSSFGWRILAVLDDLGDDRVVLQKAAGSEGPYYVGANVTKVVRDLAAVLAPVLPPQDFTWFAT